eukprot:scaffold1616_cov395-Prasinococcus_capsulatus_cf.AAC.2
MAGFDKFASSASRAAANTNARSRGHMPPDPKMLASLGWGSPIDLVLILGYLHIVLSYDGSLWVEAAHHRARVPASRGQT